MKLRSSTLCGLSALAISLGIAAGQEGERKGPPSGGDGAARIGQYLKRADADNDGKVSKEEFLNNAKSEAEERFGRADGNNDGFIDETEMSSMAERMREGMRDGARRPGGEGPRGGAPGGGFRRPPGEGAGGTPPPPPGDRGAGGPPPNIDELFGRMDKNSDGSVDRDEYTAFSQEEIQQRFGRADEDSNGKLSKDEVRQAAERLRNLMRGPGRPDGPRGPGGFGGREGERPGGFRRPPGEESERPRPESETPKKDAA